MFENKISYPCAIADDTDEGRNAALRWLIDHMEDSEKITLWVPLKQTLRANSFLIRLSNDRKVRIRSREPLRYVRSSLGPVLAMYVSPDRLAYVANANGIKALAVVRGSYELETWARETHSEKLGGGSVVMRSEEGGGAEGELSHEIVMVLERLTRGLNQNNVLTCRGEEKSLAVSHLLHLHDKGVFFPVQQMMEWCAAHGWGPKRPAELGELVERINQGIRPRMMPAYKRRFDEITLNGSM
ncbi:MAG: hypothetical protein E6925_03775 [Actinomyces sp.]|uniref:hypothetical protein n=1 Tax=Actinomyces sp. TaxID=29317 RepID=UPI0025DAB121|nr:hypothetical protein [Actinomyces sp.]MDU1430810.1 hypothetical protein [Actinomyces sp.]